jgi:hypothetical protein
MYREVKYTGMGYKPTPCSPLCHECQLGHVNTEEERVR